MHTTALIVFRWIQWLLSAVIFGIVFAYLLTDVNWYLFLSTTEKAQVGLAGFLHIYMYLSAISASSWRRFPLFWAIMDGVFSAVAIAVAGLAQPMISTYCTSSTLTWDYSVYYFAFVPPQLRVPSDLTDPATADLALEFNPTFLKMACGFNAAVIALAAILVILFIFTIIIQVQQHRRTGGEIYRQVSTGNTEMGGPMAGMRRSFAPFLHRNLDA